jgi:hypothetical protein
MGYQRNWRISETEYPAIRRVMGPERYRLDDDQLGDRLAELFPDAAPEDVENFMRTIQNFGNQVAPLAQKALPGVMQGAAQGAMVAGPWGALAGAVGGGAASLLGGGPARPPVAPSPGAPPAPLPPPLAAVPGPTPGAPPNAAVAQLLALLSRPETLQALLSMLMAGAGRGSVQVGGHSVPPAAFANAVSELAAEAIERVVLSPAAGISDYLVDGYGSPRCDLANPRSRAALLLGDVAALAVSEAAEEEADTEMDDDTPDEWFGADDADPIDSYEAALEGREDY